MRKSDKVKEFPNPMQVLFLWNLIFGGGGAWMADVRPVLQPRLRKEIEKAGLTMEEWRKSGKGRRKIYVSATDRGWKWANDHLDAEFSKRSIASGPALKALLHRIGTFLKTNDFSLAELLFASDDSEEGEGGGDGSPAPDKRVEAAYFEASGGRWNVRVRLAVLRRLMRDMAGPELDNLLLKMQKEGRLVLYNMDDVHNITAEDHEAAMEIAGFKRHILYMEEPDE